LLTYLGEVGIEQVTCDYDYDYDYDCDCCVKSNTGRKEIDEGER
jgi:hypothetical protein